jgi:hypothetical protein
VRGDLVGKRDRGHLRRPPCARAGGSTEPD